MQNRKVTHRSDVPSIYRYNSVMVVLASLVTLVCALFVPFLGWLFIPRRDVTGIAIMIVISPLPLVFLGALLSRQTLIVDEAGVSARVMGVRAKTLGWGQVGKISKRRSIGYGGVYTETFQIQDATEHSLICRYFVNFCGNIAFTEDIRCLRDLLDQLNFYARQYKIPLVVIDGEAAAGRSASRLPAERRRIAVGRIPETTVDEL
jgi:hypothetical protein